MDNLAIINPTTGVVSPISTTGSSTTTTIASGILTPPGIVAYNGSNYTLTEGVLSLFSYLATLNSGGITYTPYSSAGYRIVSPTSGFDHHKLLGGICMLLSYGNEDEGLSTTSQLDQIRYRRIFMRCEPQIDLAMNILGQRSVTMRKVRLLTATTPNDLDDGHVALEYQSGGVWKFVDIANDGYFSISGTHKSLEDMIVAGVSACTFNRLAATEASPGTSTANTGSNPIVCHPNLRPYADNVFLGTAQYATWSARIFQIPGIVHTDGLTYFYMPSGTSGSQSWVLGLSADYRVISHAAWLTMFY